LSGTEKRKNKKDVRKRGNQCLGDLISSQLALTLFECAVGPNYQRASVKSPLSWRFEEKEARAVANCPWWGQFEDPGLNERFALRLQNTSIEGCR
jgi:hypothetical protein